MKLISLLLLFVLLGCSTMSKEACESVDWFEKGKEDIWDGKTRSVVKGHQKSCKKHGVSVDMAAYNKGWDTAAKKYCTAENGLSVGKSGRQYYSGTCPKNLEVAFDRQYKIGRKIYVVSSDIETIDRKIQMNFKNKDKIAILERQKKDKERVLEKLEAKAKMN